MKIVTVEQMRAIEKEADEAGYLYAEMMANAGQAIAEEVLAVGADLERKKVVGLVGAGNNGGDCLVALKLLAEADWEAVAYLIKPRKGDPLLDAAGIAGVSIIEGNKDAQFRRLGEELAEAEVLLDGILGTGAKLPLRKGIKEVLQFVQSQEELPYVVAIDCPSGVDCDSGEADADCLQADMTVCLGAMKQGLLKFPAFGLCGEMEAWEIGLEDFSKMLAEIPAEIFTDALLEDALPQRDPSGHKGTFGSLRVIGGSINYPGSVLLAAQAAYRCGVGLVQMTVPGQIQSMLVTGLPEATWLLLPEEMGLIHADAVGVLQKDNLKVSAIVFGPGLGRESCTQKFTEAFLQSLQEHKGRAKLGFLSDTKQSKPVEHSADIPLLIDADGLHTLSKLENWETLLPAKTVLTPHPGEMAVLTGLSVEEIQKDRAAIATRFAKKWSCVVVLKGAFTVAASPDGRRRTIAVADSALAKAGSGDVLSGMIGSLMAQGLEPFEAASVGSYLHAKSAQAAVEYIGSARAVLPTDFILALSELLPE